MIYADNRKVIGPDANRIEPGQRLTIRHPDFSEKPFGDSPSLARRDDGVCDQREGPNRLITLRASTSPGPAVDVYDGGPLGLTAVLPTGGFRSLDVDAAKVVSIDAVPSPGNRYKYLTVLAPGVAHLNAVSNTGQRYSLAIRVHC